MTDYRSNTRSCLFLLLVVSLYLQLDASGFAAGKAALSHDLVNATTPAVLAGVNTLPRPMLATNTCATTQCHARLLTLPAKHGPVLKRQCLPCHQPVDGKHEFAKRQGTTPVCRDCHQAESSGKARHKDADSDCLTCHDPHGGKEHFFLRARSSAGLCLDCHPTVAQKHPLHRFMDNDACLACHELHHAAAKPLLKAPRDQVCLSCHADVRKGIALQTGSVHQPVAKDCTLCHSVHGGGDGAKLTKNETPKLCQACHAGLVARAENAKYPHQPVLHDQRCAGCHDPHFSPRRSLLKASTRDLCLECHDRTYHLKDGTTLANVKEQLTQSRYVHGPARQGACTPCHDAHGTDNPRLLKYDFPSGFYAPFMESRYELCFRCHNRQMVLERQSEVTRFRNGERNLHYLHVNQEKGRSCRACHHEHASNSPLRIRDSVPFGNWTMPLIYQKTETGGSCQNSCHAERGYDRFHPVQNPTDGAKTP